MDEIIGFIAAGLTAIAFLPQAIKTWRERDATQLSVMTLLAQTCGVAIWIVYGIRIGSTPVIASNIVTISLMLLLITFKWRFRQQALA